MTPSIDNTPLLDETEAAKFLAIQPCTLRKWRLSGSATRLPFVRVGRRIRYRVSDVEKFIAANSVGAITTAD